ncbi:MAG TPA: 50S ribosomal protein L25/general stress protein Ctc, partial [Thermodesulfobacteriota bacterium]|nr:50S ribosomal protein L25/general stress protein Ctc [Thermodesulfobacteriota bacterium]
MNRLELTAIRRERTGKGASRQVRREGRIPAVLYGQTGVTLPLALKPQELRAALAAGGKHALITLRIEQNGGPAQTRVVMLKDYQVHPVQRTLLHADLYEVRMDRAITVEVPIRLTGRADGVKAGGILEQVHRTITVECLPDRIPEALEIDVTPLGIGQSLHAGDLTLPEGVKLKTAAGETLVTIVAPSAEAAPAAAEAAAATPA